LKQSRGDLFNDFKPGVKGTKTDYMSSPDKISKKKATKSSHISSKRYFLQNQYIENLITMN